MKALLTIALVLFVQISSAKEVVTIAPIKFSIQADDAFFKLEDSIFHPQGILEKFVPAGMSYRNKVVRDNYIEFVGTKRVLMFSKTITMRGFLTAHKKDDVSGSHCYDGSVDFSTSDRLLSDNWELLEIDFCVTEKSNNTLELIVSPKLHSGGNYDSVFGPIIKNVMIDQINPVIKAIKQDIESK